MSKIEALKVAISRTKHGVMRINDVVRDVNAAWVEAGEPYPLPMGEYKRRAWLLADLERMLAQLVDEAHAEALEMNKFRDEQMAPSNYGYRPSFRIMSQWEIKAFLAAAHAEALEMNDEYDIAKVNAARVQSQHCNASRERQERWLAEAHGEALEMNAETDGISVSNSKPKIMRFRRLQYFFCGTCCEVMDKKTKALFDFCKPELQQAFPEHGEEELFSVFSQKFSRELKDYIFFDHFTAISARPQPCVIRGVVLGVRFDALSSAIRANGYNSIH
ncbi:hypothetical protein QCJ93_000648 [Enterobacter bugandensis]|nr:hypothetical protein [Enterobacter bugandensis]